MKSLGAIGVIVLAACAIGACTSLKPGRCNQDGDCQAGSRCDLDPTPQGNGRCVAIALGDGGGADGNNQSDGGGGADAAANGGKDGAVGGASGADAKPTCTDAQCTGATPFCGLDGLCHSCAAAGTGTDAGAEFCSTKNAALPVCGPGGACVACVASSDCTLDMTKPICDTGTSTCVKCAADAQCVAKLGADPGVCMAHEDGRCATDDETIYVQKTSGCPGNPGTGSAVSPYCSLDPVAAVVSSSRDLVVIRGTVQAGTWTLQQPAAEVSFVGQATASVGAGTGPALHISGASVYLRAIELSAPFDIGIEADPGSTLRLDTVLVDNCKGGGILLDQSNFDIRNTTVTGNGPGDMMGAAWGGIRINSPPAGPMTLELVTVKDNKQVGLSCSVAVTGTGMLVTGNAGGVDVSPTCNVTPCTPASPTCGASGL